MPVSFRALLALSYWPLAVGAVLLQVFVNVIVIV